MFSSEFKVKWVVKRDRTDSLKSALVRQKDKTLLPHNQREG